MQDYDDDIFADTLGTPLETSFCITSLNGKYVHVDEYTTEMAGFDSPQQMLGKTDADCPWQGNDGNERRRLIDALCRVRGWHTSTNWCFTTAGWRQYSMTETLKREHGTQYFHFNSIETTQLCDYQHWLPRVKFEDGVIDLGPAFAHAQLTHIDCRIARYRLLGYNHKDILTLMPNLTAKALQHSIKHWQNCRRDAESLRREFDPRLKFEQSVMVSSGLTPMLLENEDWFFGRDEAA